jgi:DNA polymerase (family X)
MKNSEIANIFQDIADLLEIKGEIIFKVRAYQKAARAIENLPQEITSMVESGKNLKDIPGVGEAISGKIAEIVKTGKLQYYENLKLEFPSGITALLEIPGIGPKTAKKLSDTGINNIDDLEKAILDGRVANIFRLGDKAADNILRQIHTLKGKEQRIPVGEAMMVVDEIFDALHEVKGVKNLTPAGSLRRFKDTVGDIDLMGTADDPERVITAFIDLPQVDRVLASGPTKASVVLKSGLQVDLRMVEHDSFGSLLQYFTGSKQHNITLRLMAQRRGLSLSEYGITDVKTNKLEKFATEEDFYKRLNLPYIPPEIREDQHEIELAEQGKLPKLIESIDIKGDFHVHTDWSDGQGSIKDITLAAKAMGYEYVAITDHSRALGIAHGLDSEKLTKQINEIKDLNREMRDFHIFSGVEVDIRSDGTLDLPSEILSQLDIVIGAIHSGLNESEEHMTKRVISALENPDVDILAHLTGRIIGSRSAVSLDIEAVFKAAIEFHKALEINAMPNRLDLKDVHIKRAKELGVKLTIGTDSHQTAHLGYMRFGISVARRGWCSKNDILNSKPTKEVLKYLLQ